MEDPYPAGKYPDQNVWVWVPFSSLKKRPRPFTHCRGGKDRVFGLLPERGRLGENSENNEFAFRPCFFLEVAKRTK